MKEPNSWVTVTKAQKQKCDGCGVTETVAVTWIQAVEGTKETKNIGAWIMCRYHLAVLLSRVQLVINHEVVKLLWASNGGTNAR